MRKWLFRSLIVIALIAAIPIGGIILNLLDYQTFSHRVRDEQLHTTKADWPGNALDQSNRFMDERNPFLPNTLDLIKWRFGARPFAEEKKNDPWRVEVKDPSAFLASDNDGIMWLGHATFYIRLKGVAILTDPVFGEPAVLRRVVAVPSPLEKIRDVDYVLLSHDHRDHMDEETLRAIAVKFPNAAFLAGLRSEDVLNEWKTPTNPVLTAGWFQQFDLPQDIKIYFHPVRHWSRRFLLDTNWRLWGSFVIQQNDTTIYFGGDSGYAEHYRELSELYPGIDYLLVGIGAYEPRWFMYPNHNSPEDALTGFRDSGARTLIPMHHGTFDLSDEPPSQPLRLLLEAANRAGIRDRVKPLAINESMAIE